MPNLIIYAIPIFIIMLIAEIIFTAKISHTKWDWKDTGASLCMGIGNVLTGFLTKVLVFTAYMLVYSFSIFEFGTGTLWWILLFFAEDFTYYWFHRLSHNIRYLWASHVVHHSSQHYNLSTALRQTWTGQASGAFIFWLWLPLVGFHPLMVLTMQSISLIYQFWIHTEAIIKLPRWFEFIFNTPSHHRVHHSSETQYLDKNHAGVLIVWDKLFGTYISEKPNVFPTYGLTKNITSKNPFFIAFHEWRDMALDFWQAPNFRIRWLMVFGNPGFKANYVEKQKENTIQVSNGE
jgi:sterol desaturase/sphingolipid hydroxylase (fatty acid hydroxylase superfamily)